MSWANTTIGKAFDPYEFFYPELTNYKSDDLIGTETEEFAKRLFIDEDTALTDKWRAAMMANYTMGVKWDDYNVTSNSLNEMYNSSTFVLTFT